MDLTPAEQTALAPLAADWDKLEPLRRRKWLEIANRFPEWTPEEQARRQDRMRELVHLTPEQRRTARDTFTRAQALPPEKRAELFRQYQDLPEERKAQLAAEARASRSVVPAKPLQAHRLPVPSKAQIREGSEQKVPGLPHPVLAAPASAPPAPGSGDASASGAGSAPPAVAPTPAAAPAATVASPAAGATPAVANPPAGQAPGSGAAAAQGPAAPAGGSSSVAPGGPATTPTP